MTSPEARPDAPSSGADRRRRTLATRLGGFFGFPLLSTIAPFIVLPVASRTAGDGWGAILAAQSIGTVGGIAVTFGWAIYGPPAVAQASSEAERQRLYHDSLVVRGLATTVVLPVVLLLTWLTLGSHRLVDGLVMAASFTAAGLLPTWYCIGVGKPMLMARYDVLPRLAASLVSIPLLVWTRQIWIYPALMTLALVVPTWMFSRRILTGYDAAAQPRRSVAARVRQTAGGAGIDAAGNAYASAPVPIATAALTGAESSAFGSADKLYRLGLGIVVGSLANAFQGWVLEPASPDPRRRQLVAIGAHAVTGLVGFGFLTLLGPWVTGMFFGADGVAPRAASAWFGVTFFFVSLATPLVRNLLIPAGRGRYAFAATVVSSVVGVTIMAIGASRRDPTVIAMGLALSEVMQVLLLSGPALRLLPPVRSGPRAT